VAKEKNQPRISQITRKKKLDSRFAPERFQGNFSSNTSIFLNPYIRDKKKQKKNPLNPCNPWQKNPYPKIRASVAKKIPFNLINDYLCIQ
jgi:hypothetical protein